MRKALSYLILAFAVLMLLTAPLWAPWVDAEPRHSDAEVMEI